MIFFTNNYDFYNTEKTYRTLRLTLTAFIKYCKITMDVIPPMEEKYINKCYNISRRIELLKSNKPS